MLQGIKTTAKHLSLPEEIEYKSSGKLGWGALGWRKLGWGGAGLGEARLGGASLGEAGLGEAGLGDAGLREAGWGETGQGDTGLGLPLVSFCRNGISSKNTSIMHVPDPRTQQVQEYIGPLTPSARLLGLSISGPYPQSYFLVELLSGHYMLLGKTDLLCQFLRTTDEILKQNK